MIYRWAGLTLIAMGVLILLQIAYTDVYTNFKQRQLQNKWEKSTSAVSEKKEYSPALSSTADGTPESTTTTRRPQETPATTIARAQFEEEEPFARIIIPKIDLDAIVVEGVGTEALKLGPGHMEETPYPGEVGNMVISGHRVTYSRPFYYLDELEIGDLILVSDATEQYAYYVVETKVVKPTDVSVIEPTEDRTLTLTTCNPRFSAKTRLIIVAKMRDDG